MKKVAYIGTVLSLVDVLEKRSREISDKINIVYLFDETLLQEIIENNKVTKVAQNKINLLLKKAEKETSAVLITCSSIGEFCETVQLSIPIFRIDVPMTKFAISLGHKIAVIATLETTLIPTVNLINKQAVSAKKEVSIKPYLCEDAFIALKKGDYYKHNNLIQEKLLLAFTWAEVIILAQASMANSALNLPNPNKIPILNSIDTGLLQIKDFIELS